MSQIIQKEYTAPEELRQLIISAPDSMRKKVVADWLSQRGVIVDEDDVFILKGSIPALKDNLSFTYSVSELEWLHTEISEMLEKYSVPLEPVITSKEVNDHYSHKEGWDGKEPHPLKVKEAWDRYGFVDFRGHDISDPGELAALWSIYRNPLLEYSHIVLLKDGQIVHQTCMTAGISVFTLSYPLCGIDMLKKRYDSIDYDSIYILHNHPRSDKEPSGEDIETAMTYRDVFGDSFKGSIILGDSCYHLITSSIGNPLWKDEFRHPIKFSYPVSPHNSPEIHKLSSVSVGAASFMHEWFITHKEEVDNCWKISDSHKRHMAIGLLDGRNFLIAFLPFDCKSYSIEKIKKIMIDSFATDCFLITDDKKAFNIIKKRIVSSYGKESYQPIIDCVLVSSDGYVSMKNNLNKFRYARWDAFLSDKERHKLLKDRKHGVIADAGLIPLSEAIRRQMKKAKEKGEIER